MVKTEIKKKLEGKQQFCIISAGFRRNRKGSGSGTSLTIVEGKQCRGQSCRPRKSSSCKCKADDDCECRKPKRSCKCPKPKPCVRIFEYNYRLQTIFVYMFLLRTHQFLPFTELYKLRWWHEWGNKCCGIERINEYVF